MVLLSERPFWALCIQSKVQAMTRKTRHVLTHQAVVRRWSLPVNFPAAVASAGAIPLHPSGGRQPVQDEAKRPNSIPSPRQPQDKPLARVKPAARKGGSVHLDAVEGMGGQPAATGMAAKVRRSSRSSKPTFPCMPLPFVLVGSWSTNPLPGTPQVSAKLFLNCDRN